MVVDALPYDSNSPAHPIGWVFQASIRLFEERMRNGETVETAQRLLWCPTMVRKSGYIYLGLDYPVGPATGYAGSGHRSIVKLRRATPDEEAAWRLSGK